MKTQHELLKAIECWNASAYYPHAAIIPINECEFEFCDPEADGAIAAKIAWSHDAIDGAEVHGLHAWEYGNPSRYWTYDRESHPVVGWDVWRRCRSRKEPVRLVETPAEWLQQVGSVVCILDWSGPLRAIFDGLEVACPSLEYEKRYRRAWKWKPTRPSIWRERPHG